MNRVDAMIKMYIGGHHMTLKALFEVMTPFDAAAVAAYMVERMPSEHRASFLRFLERWSTILGG